ncbi:MAG: hypothetical protein ABH986_06070 [archaeon]
MKIKFKRKRYSGGLESDSKKALGNVLRDRKYRRNQLIYHGAAGGMIGGFALFSGAKPLSFLYPPAITLSYAYSKGSKWVRESTRYLKKKLKEEVRANAELKTFLKDYKYVFVDKKGRLAGTNFPRIAGVLGIGRIRIKTKDIVES